MRADAVAVFHPVEGTPQLLAIVPGTQLGDIAAVWEQATEILGESPDALRAQGCYCQLIRIEAVDENTVSRPRLIDDCLDEVQVERSHGRMAKAKIVTSQITVSAKADDDVLPEFQAEYEIGDDASETLELFFTLVSRGEGEATYKVRLWEDVIDPAPQLAASSRRVSDRSNRRFGSA